MSVPYKVWTDEEVKNRNVVPDGNYPFEIMTVTVKKTKGGRDLNGKEKEIFDMLELEYNFWDENGVIRKMKDWIVFMPNMDWKYRHLAKSIKELTKYENGMLDEAHLVGKKGAFLLGHKEYTNQQGEKVPQNFVKDYIFDVPPPVANDGSIDDDIPDSFTS